MPHTFRVRAALCAALLFAAVNAGGQLVEVPRPHDSGLSVTPSFEGWFPNPDGTFTLSFGYMNRNRKQELDIPIGQNNRLEPGPADQGQPTHFAVRRHTGVFTVIVPRDFGKKTLTWTLTSNGETISIPGHLRPEWMIDALEEITSGNTPPVLRFDPKGAAIRGPTGGKTTLTASRSQPMPLHVWVEDDGIGKRAEGRNRQAQASEQPPEPSFGVIWYKHRGPGRVSFAETDPKIGEDSKASTIVTFSEPGDYVLRVLAWDLSGRPSRGVMAVGFQCCWTNGYVHVKVK